ncbi:MAG: ATP-binding protein, partial [Pseudomonadota bacterium]|nr:ATP-binding protein [Pseudomonadota bacterium]
MSILPMAQINRDSNRITVEGSCDVQSFHYLLSHIHHAIEKAGYQEIILDFGACTSAYPSSMVAICAQVMSNRDAGIDIATELPSDNKLLRLFQNTNWAYLLDPRKYDPSTFRGYTQVPVTQYKTPEEQHDAVNRIVNAILGAIPNMERSDFAAFEWSINEITDNVLTHAQSPIGGVVQVSTFQRNKKLVQFIVADAGVGIPHTLRETHPELTSDTDALDKAIREGVTRDKSVGQGNGLFGSYQICSHCNGKFQVDSGHGRLLFTENKGLRVSNEKIPYAGTLVVAEIDFSKPHLLEEALKFGGEKYTPVDFVETNYESIGSERIVFKMKEEAESFGSRPAGTPVRNKLKNLFAMSESQKIFVDFE